MKDHFRERVGPVAYAGFIPGRVLWAAVIREKRTQPFGLGLVGTAAASTTAAAPLVFGPKNCNRGMMRCVKTHENMRNHGKATKWNARFISFSRCLTVFGFLRMTSQSYTPEL